MSLAANGPTMLYDIVTRHVLTRTTVRMDNIELNYPLFFLFIHIRPFILIFLTSKPSQRIQEEWLGSDHGGQHSRAVDTSSAKCASHLSRVSRLVSCRSFNLFFKSEPDIRRLPFLGGCSLQRPIRLLNRAAQPASLGTFPGLVELDNGTRRIIQRVKEKSK